MDKRVIFDFEITFKNGGGMQGQQFRLDIHDSTIEDDQLQAYIVRDLNLLMIEQCKIVKKQIIEEAHKRNGPQPTTEIGTLYLDLSHTVKDGMITYKGLPAPLVCDYMSREDSRKHYAEGTSFQIGSITLCSNTGTYVDSPFHRYEDGNDLSQLALENLANLDSVVVRVPKEVKAIDESYFQHLQLEGKAVLVRTDWSDHWASDQYFENHPYLTEAAAIYLRDQKVRLVGIDSYNIDDIEDGRRPVHSTLLGADITIVEHINNMKVLPDKDFKFFAVPVKVEGMGTFPVRAFGLVENG